MSKNKNRVYNIPLIEMKRLKGGSKKGEIGLEIECEGLNLVQGMVDYWLCHPDNSLRSVKDHPPQEYVLREPLDRKDVPKALKYLSAKLQGAGSEPVYSHRTSVHVHLNCQRLTVQQIYQIWCLYTVFEELLIEFSGPDRPGNLFCLSSKQAEYQVFNLQNSLMSENFEDVFNDNLRYTSCNMASLGKFGSLEFRSMRGTVDRGLIQTWVDILCLIKDKALEYKNPQEIVKDFQRLNTEAFLKKTFSEREDILAILSSYSDRHKKMWDGLRLMRDVAYAIEWEERIKDEPKKSPETEQKDLVILPDDIEDFIPGAAYKKYVTEDDIDNIEQNLYDEYHFNDEDYWVVNYSEMAVQTPRLATNGQPHMSGQMYTIPYGMKAFFTGSNSFYGYVNNSEEDTEIGQQLSQ